MPAIGSSPHFGARVSGPRLGHADLTYRSAYLRFEHLGPGAALSSLALTVMASITYYGPAHTDGDISVTFAEADILHTGDTFWNGFYPFIDYSTGSGIDGMIKATEANLATATDKTIVIPGHGNPVSNRTELSAYRDMLVAIHDNVARLKQQGRPLEETIGAKPTAAFDAKWGQFLITPALFTRLVYEGV